MPEVAPPPGAPSPPEAGPAPAEALAEAGKLLEQIATGIAEDAQVPDEVKQLFQASLSAYKQGFEALTGGGGDSDAPADPGAAPMEAGVSGAKPMSMRRPG